MNGFDSRASRPRRRWASWLVFVVGLLAGVGLAVPAALAAPGALSFAECNGDASGCTPTSPSGALTGADAVVLAVRLPADPGAARRHPARWPDPDRLNGGPVP